MAGAGSRVVLHMTDNVRVEQKFDALKLTHIKVWLLGKNDDQVTKAASDAGSPRFSERKSIEGFTRVFGYGEVVCESWSAS